MSSHRGGALGLVGVSAVVGAGSGLVDDRLTQSVAREPARAGETVQRSSQQSAVELGDQEPAAEGAVAVAVIVEGEERLLLGPLVLATEQDRLVPGGEVGIDPGVHPPGRLAEPASIHRPPAAVAVAGGLGDQPLLGEPDLVDGRLGR